MDHSKELFRICVMFIVGFMSYITVEVLYRGYSYALMGTMGGIAFILVDRINERYDWNVELPYQAVLGGIYATALELVYGLIDRYVLQYHMWDYSNEMLNFKGIICPRFTIYWILLCVIAVLVADFVNYCIFRDTQTPYYMVFGHRFNPIIYDFVQKIDQG